LSGSSTDSPGHHLLMGHERAVAVDWQRLCQSVSKPHSIEGQPNDFQI
jgi:hypothetical protein